MIGNGHAMGPIYDTIKILHTSYDGPYLDMLREVFVWLKKP
jgi:hypothetical protein